MQNAHFVWLKLDILPNYYNEIKNRDNEMQNAKEALLLTA